MSYDLRIRSECLGFRGHHRPASAASTTCMAALLRRLFCSLELGFRLRRFLPISYRRCTLQTTHICPRRIKFGSVKYSQCIYRFPLGLAASDALAISCVTSLASSLVRQ